MRPRKSDLETAKKEAGHHEEENLEEFREISYPLFWFAIVGVSAQVSMDNGNDMDLQSKLKGEFSSIVSY